MPEPITLSWKKLSATAKDKPILKEVSGFCKPGELLAVMGPSGSGKTTFLSLLTYKSDPTLTIAGKVTSFLT
jgi:ABC-type multidrug transport system ATPase subunit